LYAVVNTPGGAFEGLYVTKDFGLNWTKVRLPVKNPGPKQISTNDDSSRKTTALTAARNSPGQLRRQYRVDPNNANIVYIGGRRTPTLPERLDGGFIRVDITTVQDPYALVAYDNSNNDGGLTQTATTGGVAVKAGGNSVTTGLKLGPGNPYGSRRGPFAPDPTLYLPAAQSHRPPS